MMSAACLLREEVRDDRHGRHTDLHDRGTNQRHEHVGRDDPVRRLKRPRELLRSSEVGRQSARYWLPKGNRSSPLRCGGSRPGCLHPGRTARRSRSIPIPRVPQRGVPNIHGISAGLSRPLLCSSVLDDRNGRPAHRFRSIRRQRNQAVTTSTLYRDLQLPRQVALRASFTFARSGHFRPPYHWLSYSSWRRHQ
jgi:hypothetical protein